MTEFPEVYTQSVINLQSVAPKCLQQSQYPKFDLPDGSSRRTFGLESGDGVVYPGCLRTESLTIHSHYNILDSLLSRLIMRVAGSGGDTDWSSSKLNTRGEFSTQLYKVRLHSRLHWHCSLSRLAGTYPRIHQVSVLNKQGERFQVRSTISY